MNVAVSTLAHVPSFAAYCMSGCLEDDLVPKRQNACTVSREVAKCVSALVLGEPYDTTEAAEAIGKLHKAFRGSRRKEPYDYVLVVLRTLHDALGKTDVMDELARPWGGDYLGEHGYSLMTDMWWVPEEEGGHAWGLSLPTTGLNLDRLFAEHVPVRTVHLPPVLMIHLKKSAPKFIDYPVDLDLVRYGSASYQYALTCVMTPDAAMCLGPGGVWVSYTEDGRKQDVPDINDIISKQASVLIYRRPLGV